MVWGMNPKKAAIAYWLHGVPTRLLAITTVTQGDEPPKIKFTIEGEYWDRSWMNHMVSGCVLPAGTHFGYFRCYRIISTTTRDGLTDMVAVRAGDVEVPVQWEFV